MKVGYLHKDESTAAWIGSDPGMVGIARRRPGDRWNPVVGLAVALLKAEFDGPSGQDKNVIMVDPFSDEIESFELSDSQVLVWADMRHGLRLALRSVEDRRTRYGHGFGIQPAIAIPSDGQLCENFALRFINEADLQIA